MEGASQTSSTRASYDLLIHSIGVKQQISTMIQLLTNPIALIQSKTPIKQTLATSPLLKYLSLVLALLAISCTAILIRWSEQDLGAIATVFNRFWIASLVFNLGNGYQYWHNQKSLSKIEAISMENQSIESLFADLFINFNYSVFWCLIISAIVASASAVCLAWSVETTSLANSALLRRNLIPLFTSIGAWLFWQKPLENRFLWGMGLAMVGAIAIGYHDWQVTKGSLCGDAIAICSALFYATNLLLVEHLRQKLPTTTILLWRCTLGTLFLLPLTFFTEGQLFPSTWQGWLISITLAVFCQVIGQGLIVVSLKNFSSRFVSVAMLLEPIITAFLAWAIFDESLSLVNLLAFMVVICGIYLAKV